MQHQNPYCQMCRKELCVVCQQKLDNCKCPCPNFVICKYCEVHEKTLPPCDDMVPPIGSNGFGSGGGGFGGGSMGKMLMPLMMMMMMNANKNGGVRICQCSKRGRDRKRSRNPSPRRDRDAPQTGHPCCCKTVPNLQPMPVPSYPQPAMIPPNTGHQSCCKCSPRGDVHNQCREPINQYFFGSECNPQVTMQPASQVPYPEPRQKSSAATSIPPQAHDGSWDRSSSNPQPRASANPQPKAFSNPQPRASSNPQPRASSNPQPTASPNPQPTASPSPQPNAAPKKSSHRDSKPQKLQYSRHKPENPRNNSIVVNKV